MRALYCKTGVLPRFAELDKSRWFRAGDRVWKGRFGRTAVL